MPAGCSRGRPLRWCGTPEITRLSEGQGAPPGFFLGLEGAVPQSLGCPAPMGQQEPQSPALALCSLCRRWGASPVPAALPPSAGEHRTRQGVMFLIMKFK